MEDLTDISEETVPALHGHNFRREFVEHPSHVSGRR